ncbi:ABC-2 type transport system ATP-binding protein [Chitinophaga niastensis]|uniref:ABC-2 type transport system ATP-binding protein n=1 Tax=Chitinophaga niastensis TaxID=536980 RepID=A0A2P8HNX2_CHINA|nr:ATP-binding cassette domain-containing protein [Chitinophaga niastensis]PSL47924.1 ABC-2 type transport system ATP-binding protein [Chitinophaga niastensis]
MSTPIVQIEHLSYHFGQQLVLDDITLEIPGGSIYGFLGPNGAGKTTTLRLLLGLLRKRNACIRLFGADIATNRIAILKRVGSLIEQPSLYLQLTGRENLEVFRRSYQCPKQRINEVLEMVDLLDAGNKKAGSYSLGMKQRLAIAVALLHDPELLVLDEPTNGLDPNGIIATRALIHHLNTAHGKTILISSHLLSEVEKMATHVGIIHKGRLLFNGTLSALQQLKSNHARIEIEVNDPDKAMLLLKDDFEPLYANGKISVAFESQQRTAQLNALLHQQGIEVYKIFVIKDDLENLFVKIINN